MWNALFSSGEPEKPAVAALKEVTLTVNGASVTVGDADVTATTSLNTFLRDNLKLTGTKFNCGEGFCGACTVVAKVEHPVTHERQTLSVNSCLVPVLSCQGWEVTTIEGVGNRKDNYHQVQTQLAEFNGTQCGFCSPGFAMNMFSMVGEGAKPTMEEVENAFGGNLCRCTGYRSILEAYKAMASDAPPAMKQRCADIEDLYKTCPKTGKSCAGDCKKADPKPGQKIELALGAETWHRVTTIDDLFAVFGEIGDEKYKLVAGNTAEGVHRSTGVTRFIDVRDIPELRGVETSPAYLLGANVSLAEAVLALRQQAGTANFAYLNDVADYWSQIANVAVRNVGTLAGNLALKKEYPDFVSDVFTVLEAVGATLHILTAVGQTNKVSPLDFLSYDMNKKVVRGVELPALDDTHLMRFLHVLPRSQGSLAQVNAAFVVKRSSSSSWDVAAAPRLVFGGVGNSFVHASTTEAFLDGKNLFDTATVSGAIQSVWDEIKPEEARPAASADHRRKVAVGLFYRFLLALDPAQVDANLQSGAQPLTRDLSSGAQEYDTNASLYPLNQPIPKVEALPQVAGETEYVNDIPERPGELHGAFVLTTQSKGTITGYNTDAATAVPGFVAFYTAADLDGAPNSFTPPDVLPFDSAEEILCSGPIAYAGQPAAVVVATNQMAALQAAALVVVNYAPAIQKPVLSSKDKPKSVREKHVVIKESKKERKTLKAVNLVTGSFDIGLQYPLYVENLSCIVVPTDDGYDVYSSTQWMDLDQTVVARTAGVPINRVSVYVKRLGGGFGGKQSRPAILAGACALAAKKQNRPVRMVLPLSANMEVVSKRFGQRNDYQVGFDNDGKVEFATVHITQDSGYTSNESSLIAIEPYFTGCYGTEGYNMDGHEFFSDTASNGPVRAPGPLEGVAFHDEIMERIAGTLGKDPLEVKLLNMEKLDSPLPNMISDLQSKSDYATRRADVDTFNQQNRWKKRGMAVTPMRYPFPIWHNLNVIVSLFHGDGSVAVTHSGIEMGQGINTKVCQVAAHILGLTVDQVTVKPSTTNNGVSLMSGGGIISEGVCYATMRACQMLLERLEPIRASMENPTWQELLQSAFYASINLAAQFMWSADNPDVKDYDIWAVCISEVEVDILTGEKQVRRVDLLEDVGQSMSPLIDVGQIEGAFVMGMGYWLWEDINFDPDTGRQLEHRLQHYIAPGAKDIPVDFRVYFRQNAPNPIGVLGSKSTGEPAICLSVSVWFAIRNALLSARRDAGDGGGYFEMEQPANNEHTLEAALTNYQQFHLRG